MLGNSVDNTFTGMNIKNRREHFISLFSLKVIHKPNKSETLLRLKGYTHKRPLGYIKNIETGLSHNFL